MPENMQQNPERLGKDNQEISAKVQSKYPNCKQNLHEKENFVLSKVSESQPLFGKYRLWA